MRSFDYVGLKNQKWDSETVAYLAAIHEAKGRQELYLKQKPQELDKLVEIARIQSTETSNEIEGIRTTNTRLKQLLSDKTTPRTRDEEEIAGYRDALNVIHESYEYIPVTANYILQLHKILYSHSGKSIGGKFKNVQNYINAVGADGKEYTISRPLPPTKRPWQSMPSASSSIVRSRRERSIRSYSSPCSFTIFCVFIRSRTATAE